MRMGVAGNQSEDHRAVSFGRNAEAYDAYRPDYPDSAIAHVFALATPRSAIEVGAGTGIATRKVAREGLDLLCLEPSPQMADVLRARKLPGVTVVEETFEDWSGKSQTADLIFSAQAWHWVDPTTGMDKARSILREDGVLAVIFNIPTDRLVGLQDVYRAHAPDLVADRDERVRRRDSRDWGADMRGAGFRDTSLHTERWSRTLDAAGYRALCSTYSDHILLEAEKRARLLDAIEDAIAERGDSVTLEYVTRVYTGRR